MGSPHTHLGLIWYHSEPPEISCTTNKKLVEDFCGSRLGSRTFFFRMNHTSEIVNESTLVPYWSQYCESDILSSRNRIYRHSSFNTAFLDSEKPHKRKTAL